MPSEIKRDCFGYKMGRCTVLNDLYCAMEKCSFYKTKEQYTNDRIKYDKIACEKSLLRGEEE